MVHAICDLKFKLFLISFGVFLFLLAPSEVLAVSFTRSVFVQNVTTNSVELRWKTDTQASTTVKYGTSTSYGQQVTSDSVSGESNNHARITGLSANTKYYYQLVAGGTNLTSAGDTNYYFKTAPSTGSNTPFSFAFWGDSGNGGSNQKAKASQVNAKNPDMIIIAGDVVYEYSKDPEYNDARVFDVYANTIRHAPLYSTCGNHDASNCDVLVADHSLPQGGNASVLSSFSWDRGNVHFVALNSNTSISSGSTQLQWLDNDLKNSNQPWKVVFWHHNYWSAGSHSTITKMESAVRVANDNGANLVFWGHSHVFERWNKSSTYSNIQAYTIGNGGQRTTSSCSSSSPGPGCAAKSSGEVGFLFAEVNGNKMTIRYITQTGSNTDTITLNTSGTVSQPPTQTPTPGTQCNRGDGDGDGDVDLNDYFYFWLNFGKNLSGPQNGDFDCDNDIDLNDYFWWWQNFGT